MSRSIDPMTGALPERRALFGLALMALGALAIPLMDTLAKALGPGGALFAGAPIPPLQSGLARFVAQSLILAPFLFAVVRALPRRLDLALLRGVLIGSATALFFTGVQLIDLAAAIAVFFVEPLILLLLSAAFLRERLTARRIVAVAVGLVGAMAILRPNLLALGPAALLPLGTAVLFALYLLLTKRLAAEESAVTLQFWSGVSGAATLLALSYAGAALGFEGTAPIWPSPPQWLGLIALGIVATGVHLLITQAFRYAPASRLAPLQYLEILSAATLGWAVFGETLDQETLFGAALIIVAGLTALSSPDAGSAPRATRGPGPG